MTTKFDTLAPQFISDLLNDFPDLKPFQAAAFPGNFGAESAGFTDIIEDGALAKGWAGGTGFAQWTGMKSRRGEFEAWLKRKGWRPDSYEGNYSFMFRELKGGEGRRVLPPLRRARTIEEATRIVCIEYERPADPEQSMAARIRWAKRALARWETTKPRPTVWATDKQEAPVSTGPFPSFPAPPPLNPPVAKPWYASKTIIGAIIAVSTPILGKAIPFFGLIPDAVVAQAVENILITAGPMLGGVLAGFGRLAVTAPVAGTQAAVVVERRYEAALAQPAPEQVAAAVPHESWRELPPATSADPVAPASLMDVPFSQLVRELPDVLEAFAQLQRAGRVEAPRP